MSIAYQVASDFGDYVSGVYSSTVCESEPENVNHAVLAVGYNKDDSEYGGCGGAMLGRVWAWAGMPRPLFQPQPPPPSTQDSHTTS